MAVQEEEGSQRNSTEIGSSSSISSSSSKEGGEWSLWSSLVLLSIAMLFSG